MASLTKQYDGTEESDYKDAVLKSVSPDTNSGADTDFHVLYRQDTGAKYRSLLYFDVSEILPGTTITSASLELYYYGKGADDPVGRTYYARHLNDAGAVPAWTEAGCTWNKYDGTNSWTSAGGDYTTTNQASQDVPASFGWMSWDITSIVQHCVDNHAHLVDVLLMDSDESSAGSANYYTNFYSKEYTGDTDLRPKLVITYDYLSAFDRKRKITITGSSGGAQTNYPLKVEIPLYDMPTDNGAFEWFCLPCAEYYSGSFNRTYYAWVDNANRIYISYFDHSLRSWGSTQLVKDYGDSTTPDDHGAPSICVIKSGAHQGKILVFYARHNSQLWCRRSTYAEFDNSGEDMSFDSEVSITSNYASYPQTYDIDGTIWVFYRWQYDDPSNSQREEYKTSTDAGATWSSATNIIDHGTDDGGGGTIPYAFTYYDGEDIQIAWSYFKWATNHIKDIYYMYYDSSVSTWKKRDGTSITLPADPNTAGSEPDTVFSSQASPKTATWCWDMKVDSSGNPFITFVDDNDSVTGDPKWAHYHDSAWSVHPVGSLETVRTYDYQSGSEIDYQSGVVLDSDDPTHVFIGVNRSGVSEMEEWHTTDNGSTWEQVEAITSDSAHNHCRPQTVRNYSSDFKLFWMTKYNYEHWTYFDTCVFAWPCNYSTEDTFKGFVRGDYGDVRFADANDNLLDFWLCDPVRGIFYVEIPSIPASPDTVIIYMYYDNSSAETISDGDATFSFFDHFPGSSIDTTNKWTNRQGDVTVSDSLLNLLGTTGTRGLYDGQTAISKPAILECRARFNEDDGNFVHFCSMRQSNSWDNRVEMWAEQEMWEFQFETRSAGTPTDTANVKYEDVRACRRYKLSWKTGEGKFYIDDNLMATHTTNVPTTDLVPVVYEGSASGKNVYIDWLLVRKWADPEPTYDASMYLGSVPICWGEESPVEDYESWQAWSDGSGGYPSISGDLDWGKLTLTSGEVAHSTVKDLGDSTSRKMTVTRDSYGSGSGTVDIYVRGQNSDFNQDDASPSWVAYTEQTINWRYVQIKLAYNSGTVEVDDLVLEAVQISNYGLHNIGMGANSGIGVGVG